MGSLTDNAEKAKKGNDSLLEKGPCADHAAWFSDEYRGFVDGVLYDWFMVDPENRVSVDNGMLSLNIARKFVHNFVPYYDYDSSRRWEFMHLYARFIHFEATRRLVGAEQFSDAVVDEFDVTAEELAKEMSFVLATHDKREKPEMRALFYRFKGENVSAEKLSEETGLSLEAVNNKLSHMNDVMLKFESDLMRDS